MWRSRRFLWLTQQAGSPRLLKQLEVHPKSSAQASAAVVSAARRGTGGLNSRVPHKSSLTMRRLKGCTNGLGLELGGVGGGRDELSGVAGGKDGDGNEGDLTWPSRSIAIA
mmetsp:Transcript_22494/g.37208  ORF Transcript_22494/g.37208 Transcript_22494/m.37208 type:complete len:111 (-) Transcript_22494:1808-2140(-)